MSSNVLQLSKDDVHPFDFLGIKITEKPGMLAGSWVGYDKHGNVVVSHFNGMTFREDALCVRIDMSTLAFRALKEHLGRQALTYKTGDEWTPL